MGHGPCVGRLVVSATYRRRAPEGPLRHQVVRRSEAIPKADRKNGF
jgi:hypothetical protein